eukprot:TRINITY_DN1355_c0_g1_i1.p1 TRINITY_DN1355_c0_g1~~TRINITY_DN1355_c0_g1_i1.p1  ORF type:complete len:349 (+),score=64.58 TRINITY_DN1355_c0_g1_i1:234-1280(+)
MLKKFYHGLVGRALQNIYPSHAWIVWKFDESIPSGLWDNQELHRHFVDHLEKELKITNMEDWYNVNVEDIRRNGGGTLLQKYYRDSPSEMIISVLKEHNWELHRFTHRPKQIWDEMQSQRDLMDRLAKELNIQTMEDWYSVSKAQIIHKRAGGLLNRKYHGSPSRMITSILTEHQWNLSHFTRKPNGVWSDQKVQQDLIAHVAKQLHINNMEDWYRVTANQIRETGGKSLLARIYKDSPSKMITSLFTQHPWDLRKFISAPKGIWKDKQLQLNAMHDLAKKLNIQRMEDWYLVTQAQIIEKGGGPLLGHYHSLSRMITSVFPNHQWNMRRFDRLLKPRRRTRNKIHIL